MKLISRHAFIKTGAGVALLLPAILKGAFDPFQRPQPRISGLGLTTFSVRQHMNFRHGRPTDEHNNNERDSMSKEVVEHPKDTTHKLIRKLEAVSVDSQRAVYSVRRPNGRTINVAVVAFRDPESGRPWVGREHDLYILTKETIIRITPFHGGVQWGRPMLSMEDARPLIEGRGIVGIEEELTPEMLLAFSPPLDFEGVLDEKFFRKFPTAMAPGMPKINSAVVVDDEMRLDISSPGGDYRANVVFDEATLKLKSAVVDGRRVFPGED